MASESRLGSGKDDELGHRRRKIQRKGTRKRRKSRIISSGRVRSRNLTRRGRATTMEEAATVTVAPGPCRIFSIYCCHRTPPGLFQLQMRISFPFLRAKDLHMSLLIMRTHSFFTLLYVGGTYARLVYTWYKHIFRVIAVLIVFLDVNGKKRNLIKIIPK